MSADRKKLKSELLDEVSLLRERVAQLEAEKSLTREQKLKLAILDRAPFTVWACDREFKILLWSGKCEEVYGYSRDEALGADYLELFVDPPERRESQEECLKTIDEDVIQTNCLAYDQAKDGTRRTVLTNCFRILDEQSGDYLQAEVALEISDLELRVNEHRTLREVGIKQLAQAERTLEMLKRELTSRIDQTHSTTIDLLRKREIELQQWSDKIRVKQDDRQARLVTETEFTKINQMRCQLIQDCDTLRDTVQRAESIDDLDRLEARVSTLEAQRVVTGGPPPSTE